MEKIDSVDLLSNNELPAYFVQTHLPKIIMSLLKRRYDHSCVTSSLLLLSSAGSLTLGKLPSQ